jgi:hypothetical protein
MVDNGSAAEGTRVTEAEWLSCGDPDPMVGALPADRHQRELRLFALSCARRVWHLLPPESRAAVEVAERFADGRAGLAELRAAGAAADRVAQAHWSGGRSPDARAYAESAAGDASSEWPRTAANVLAATSCAASALACAAADRRPDGEYDRVYDATRVAELAAQAELLRGLITRPPG